MNPNDSDSGPDDFGPSCPVCGAEMDWQQCWQCQGEGGFHDCGEDCCPCLYPELDLNETCGECQGKGGYWVCPREE
jgi:hypothetical protein